jgi:hypothetical protein
MAIPEQIRRQSEAVAKLYEDLNPTDEALTSTGAEGVQSEQADEGAGAAAGPAPAEQGRPGTTKEEQTAEQRYRTLQGMYNADTGRLRAENAQLAQRLGQLEQLLSSMAAPAQPETAPSKPERLITDKDMEEYGDSIDVMRRAAREEVLGQRAEIEALRRQLTQLQTSVVPKVESVAHQQAVSAEQVFWNDLTAAVPDWRDINADQDFHSWLLEVDPVSGMPRQSFLADAQNRLDSRRVAGFFKMWQSLNGNSVAQQTRTTAATQLERQLSPGRSRASSGASAASDAKVYTRTDVAKFFDDVRRGLYRGREQERDRMERDIFAAQSEGRIT